MGIVSACGNFIVNSLNTDKKLLSQLHKCRLLYAVFHNSLDEKESSFADNWQLTICSHFQYLTSELSNVFVQNSLHETFEFSTFAKVKLSQLKLTTSRGVQYVHLFAESKR